MVLEGAETSDVAGGDRERACSSDSGVDAGATASSSSLSLEKGNPNVSPVGVMPYYINNFEDKLRCELWDW